MGLLILLRLGFVAFVFRMLDIVIIMSNFHPSVCLLIYPMLNIPYPLRCLIDICLFLEIVVIDSVWEYG